ncbi:acetyl-coenzyme A synthetase N-terminal domain-containing protein [Escherichia coli]
MPDKPSAIRRRCINNLINVPDTFWGEQGKILDWIKPYQKVKNTSFAPGCPLNGTRTAR